MRDAYINFLHTISPQYTREDNYATRDSNNGALSSLRSDESMLMNGKNTAVKFNTTSAWNITLTLSSLLPANFPTGMLSILDDRNIICAFPCDISLPNYDSKTSTFEYFSDDNRYILNTVFKGITHDISFRLPYSIYHTKNANIPFPTKKEKYCFSYDHKKSRYTMKDEISNEIHEIDKENFTENLLLYTQYCQYNQSRLYCTSPHHHPLFTKEQENPFIKNVSTISHIAYISLPIPPVLYTKIIKFLQQGNLKDALAEIKPRSFCAPAKADVISMKMLQEIFTQEIDPLLFNDLPSQLSSNQSSSTENSKSNTHSDEEQSEENDDLLSSTSSSQLNELPIAKTTDKDDALISLSEQHFSDTQTTSEDLLRDEPEDNKDSDDILSNIEASLLLASTLSQANQDFDQTLRKHEDQLLSLSNLTRSNDDSECTSSEDEDDLSSTSDLSQFSGGFDEILRAHRERLQCARNVAEYILKNKFPSHSPDNNVNIDAYSIAQEREERLSQCSSDSSSEGEDSQRSASHNSSSPSSSDYDSSSNKGEDSQRSASHNSSSSSPSSSDYDSSSSEESEQLFPAEDSQRSASHNNLQSCSNSLPPETITSSLSYSPTLRRKASSLPPLALRATFPTSSTYESLSSRDSSTQLISFVVIPSPSNEEEKNIAADDGHPPVCTYNNMSNMNSIFASDDNYIPPCSLSPASSFEDIPDELSPTVTKETHDLTPN